MAEDREMNHYYDKLEETEVAQSQPGAMIEEEEEETFVVDLGNMMAFDKDSLVEGVIPIPKPAPIPVEGSIVPLEEPKVECVEVEKPRTLKDDLLDDIMNTLASRAIRNLIEKENKRINAVYEALSKNGVSRFEIDDLAETVVKPLEARKEELRKSWGYLGNIDYTKIPEWAQRDVKQYVRAAIAGACELTEDSI